MVAGHAGSAQGSGAEGKGHVFCFQQAHPGIHLSRGLLDKKRPPLSSAPEPGPALSGQLLRMVTADYRQAVELGRLTGELHFLKTVFVRFAKSTCSADCIGSAGRQPNTVLPVITSRSQVCQQK